jgi:HAD superfamily hydrolase (TIGR01549 family)
MIKAVLFDIGNTLIDMDKAFELQVENLPELNVLKKHHIHVTQEQYIEAAHEIRWQQKDYSKKDEPLYFQKEIMALLNIPWNEKIAQEMSDAFQQTNEKYIQKEAIMPHALETLDYLHKEGYILGIVTDAGSSIAKKWVELIGRKHYFKTIIVSHEVKSKKSDLIPFKKAVEELQLKPEECLMVGDTHGDMMAAKIGMKTCLFDRYKRGASAEIKPDHIISKLIEIKKIIQQLKPTD